MHSEANNIKIRILNKQKKRKKGIEKIISIDSFFPHSNVVGTFFFILLIVSLFFSWILWSCELNSANPIRGKNQFSHLSLRFLLNMGLAFTFFLVDAD